MSYDVLRVPGRIVSFDTKPTSILPGKYRNVEVVGIVTFAIALTITDIAAKYQQVLPYIPDINKDFTKVEYVIVKQDNGTLEVLALPWIEEGTIQTTSVVNRRINLYNVDSGSDQRLAKMLKLNGFSNFTIENL